MWTVLQLNFELKILDIWKATNENYHYIRGRGCVVVGVCGGVGVFGGCVISDSWEIKYLMLKQKIGVV